MGGARTPHSDIPDPTTTTSRLARSNHHHVSAVPAGSIPGTCGSNYTAKTSPPVWPRFGSATALPLFSSFLAVAGKRSSWRLGIPHGGLSRHTNPPGYAGERFGSSGDTSAFLGARFPRTGRPSYSRRSYMRVLHFCSRCAREGPTGHSTVQEAHCSCYWYSDRGRWAHDEK